MKIGVVGAGSMGRTHASAWMDLKGLGAELVGIVANRSDGSAARLAELHGTRAYESFEALLANVDLVDVCAPTDLHRAMTVQAAQAGKHVVCEKPIALSMVDGRVMIDACAAAGVRLFVAHVLRFVPQYAVAQQSVAAGQIGKPAVLRLTRAAYQPRKATDNWFVDESRSGGMILDLMIHDYDYARWIAGNVVRVYAKSARSQRPDSPGDYALVTLRFANGAMALIEGGWAYPPGNFRTSIDIAGTDGVLEWNSDTADPLHTFLLNPPDQETADVGLPAALVAESPFTTELRHFYEALRHGEPASVTAEDGLAALQIGLAARDSLRSGRSIAIDQEAN